MRTPALAAMAFLSLACLTQAVGIIVDDPQVSACNGEQAFVSGTVFNPRASQNSYQLSFWYSDNRFTDYAPRLNVPANSAKDFRAYLTPECGLAEGRYSAKIGAESSSDGEFGSADIAIDVRSCLDASINVDSSRQVVCAGSKARFNVRLYNRGFANLSFLLSSNSTTGATFSENGVRVQPGRQKTLELEIPTQASAGHAERVRITATAFDECTSRDYSQEVVVETRDCGAQPAATASASPWPTYYPTAPAPTYYPAPTATPQPGEREAFVDIEGFAFKPAEIMVPVGTKVSWRNFDTAVHTVTTMSAPADEGFYSGPVNPGKTFSRTLYVPGTYVYYCTSHPDMRGTVTVTDAQVAIPTARPTPTPRPSATPAANATPSPTAAPTPAPTPTATPTAEPDTTELEILLNETAFTPQYVTVLPRTKITWTNIGTTDNDVTSGSTPSEDGFYSGTLVPGQGFSRVLYILGAYEFHSSLHPEAAGRVIVSRALPTPTQEPGASASPTAEVYSVESYAATPGAGACPGEDAQYVVEYANKGERDAFEVAIVAPDGVSAIVEPMTFTLDKEGRADVTVSAHADAPGGYTFKVFATSAATGVASRTTLSLQVTDGSACEGNGAGEPEEGMVEVVSASLEELAGENASRLTVVLRSNQDKYTSFNVSPLKDGMPVSTESAEIRKGEEKRLEFTLALGQGEGVTLLVKSGAAEERHELEAQEASKPSESTGLFGAGTDSASLFVVGILVGALALFTATRAMRNRKAAEEGKHWEEDTADSAPPAAGSAAQPGEPKA
ncbi:MAG: plastocyanin/azurin family copper-binding protein [Candidatus Micrarchaeota archaeon]